MHQSGRKNPVWAQIGYPLGFLSHQVMHSGHDGHTVENFFFEKNLRKSLEKDLE
jgi:hypothetical protein